jgi:hypothetical protein
MKLRVSIALLVLAIALPSGFARSGGRYRAHHKHGARHAHGHGSSHKGRRYKNARSRNHYLHH